MSRFEWTKQFSCILSSKNPDTGYDEYNKTVDDLYERMRNDVSIPRSEDIAYDETGLNTKIDIWGEENTRKVFIVIHGGYWLFGSRKKCIAFYKGAAQHGYTVVSVGYDFANAKHPISKSIEETVRGVRFAMERFKRATHFVIGGHSAGAHLAFQVVTRIPENRIKGVCLLCGIYQLNEFVFSDYGKQLGLTPEEAEHCNCHFDRLAASNLSILIMNCRLEAPKLYEQNVQFSRIVTNATYKEYANEDHFSMLTELDNPQSSPYKDFTNFLKTL